jgi:hypothetical protein
MEFYGTTAQVIPVLLLALTWETNYFDRLRTEDRSKKPVFTDCRVRWWSLFAVATALAGEATMVLVLADFLGSGAATKVLGVAGVAVLIASMTVRLFSEIWDATNTKKKKNRAAEEAPTGPAKEAS